ncbi:hypothetical protein HYW20_04390 [Candidatus Woesearchaeota archaeon]|nr:hypothetical protein [Candidatus Woesearchaeota archaeon]
MKSSLTFVIFIVILLSACTKTQQEQKAILSQDVSTLTQIQVVTLYFQAWNSKQYDIMYSLISDGFKQIEPTAKSFDGFKAYMDKFYETANGVSVIDVQTQYENDKEAGVNYKIEIIGKDGAKKDFESVYTLKKRSNGWKLIHPYGQNIDTT